MNATTAAGAIPVDTETKEDAMGLKRICGPVAICKRCAQDPSRIQTNRKDPYPAVPQAAVQRGDFYVYEGSALDPDMGSSVGIVQTTSNGGGPATIAVPDPWSPSAATPVSSPTFSFSYRGFSGIPVTAHKALLSWSFDFVNGQPMGSRKIDVFATANFQNGASTINIPNLFVGLGSPGSCSNSCAKILALDSK